MSEPRTDVLFVGIGTSAVAWYRAFLPAMFMGADWVGVYGEPPDLTLATGLVGRETKAPVFSDYRYVVLQQAYGRKWLALIRKLQGDGIKVIYEIDDYVHGLRKQHATHDYSGDFTRERLDAMELCMRVCDGMIVSTRYLARRYAKFNANVFVCENGIDTSRYNLTRPDRDTVNIGWAGATGHHETVVPWLQQVVAVMHAHADTCFVSIGQPYAEPFQEIFGPERAISVPFTMVEQYPSAMTMLDIALAPAGDTAWYRAKSDLRWVEAGALGIPAIASPHVYHHITPGVDGYWAETPTDVGALLTELVEHPDRGREVGGNARSHVRKKRDMRFAVNAWTEAFTVLASL